jgi:hypothetical protein
MSNTVEAFDVEGGSILGFTRPGGTTAYYYYAGMSAAQATANPRDGGTQISATQAQLLKSQSSAATASEILPFLL